MTMASKGQVRAIRAFRLDAYMKAWAACRFSTDAEGMPVNKTTGELTRAEASEVLSLLRGSRFDGVRFEHGYPVGADRAGKLVGAL